MPVIKVQTNGESIGEYILERGKPLSIGRGEDNDIIIPDAGVSRHHAGIEADGDTFYLTDFQSRNGTFVNQQLVIFRRLNHGDVITIGNRSLIFTFLETEERPEDGIEEMFDMTMPIDTRDHRSLLARGVTDMVTQEYETQAIGMLTYISGGTGSMVLEKETIRIGKDPASEIVVKGIMVGKSALLIRRTPNGYLISPGEGFAKPKINYKILKSETRLNEFDVIDIGSVKLQFQYKKG
ncbi:MAG: FHA domain-containing protein [Thermodesulfobacteriota bacterium]